MRVEFSKPPYQIYETCKAQFALPIGKTIYFAYGDTIYVVGKLAPGPAIMAHEEVHGEQQLAFRREDRDLEPGQRAILWWRRYLEIAEFRLAQELPAHAAELAYLMRSMSNRQSRREAISIIAGKLAAPMYGSLISKNRAKSELVRLVDVILKAN